MHSEAGNILQRKKDFSESDKPLAVVCGVDAKNAEMRGRARGKKEPTEHNGRLPGGASQGAGVRAGHTPSRGQVTRSIRVRCPSPTCHVRCGACPAGQVPARGAVLPAARVLVRSLWRYYVLDAKELFDQIVDLITQGKIVCVVDIADLGHSLLFLVNIEVRVLL